MRLGYTTSESAERNVGVTGFEPATIGSQSRRATKLRHTPVRAYRWGGETRTHEWRVWKPLL